MNKYQDSHFNNQNGNYHDKQQNKNYNLNDNLFYII